MKIRIALIAIVSVIAISILHGCKKNENSTANNMQFHITDAPGNFGALYLDIKSINVHVDGGGWVTLNSNIGVVNILDYVNGRTVMVAEGALGAVKVDEVRLILGSNNSVVVNGTSHVLNTPSAQESGLKIKMKDKAKVDGVIIWTIDFDAAQSIKESGGNFTLKPVIRLSVKGDCDIDDEDNGGNHHGAGREDIFGKVKGELILNTGSVASVCATSASGITVCTMTATDGKFTLQGLMPSTYTFSITSVVAPFTTKVVSNVIVSSDDTVDLGKITL